mmetsp:Transcript_32827/g.70610  ORF Transcript_32827/g.70610 Transcript_32827/m.70610 type:complete len:229 (-) Transcript_32827:180-866(-)
MRGPWWGPSHLAWRRRGVRSSWEMGSQGLVAPTAFRQCGRSNSRPYKGPPPPPIASREAMSMWRRCLRPPIPTQSPNPTPRSPSIGALLRRRPRRPLLGTPFESCWDRVLRNALPPPGGSPSNPWARGWLDRTKARPMRSWMALVVATNPLEGPDTPQVVGCSAPPPLKSVADSSVEPSGVGQRLAARCAKTPRRPCWPRLCPCAATKGLARPPVQGQNSWVTPGAEV